MARADLVAEVVGVGEVPAAAALVVAPVVALPGEVHPLRMPKLQPSSKASTSIERRRENGVTT